jgi:transposase
MADEIERKRDQVPSRARKRGRPPKLTPETEARILGAVRCGVSQKIACEAAGVGVSTLTAWKRIAKERGAPPEYRDFVKRLRRARQEGIVARVALVQKAAQADWRAATWLLERDCPDSYSLKHRVEHSGGITLAQALASLGDGRPPQIATAETPDEPDDDEE